MELAAVADVQLVVPFAHDSRPDVSPHRVYAWLLDVEDDARARRGSVGRDAHPVVDPVDLDAGGLGRDLVTRH